MTDIDVGVYEVAFEETNNPAIITDPNFIVRDVNQALLDFTGYERDEIIDQPPTSVFSNEDTYSELITTLSEDERWTGNFEAQTKSGVTVHGRGSAFPITNDNGDVEAYAGFFTDLTQRKQYEDTLKILNRVLRHNLKNDANVILGYITTVRDELNDDTLESFLSQAESKINSLLNHSDTARNLQTLLSGETRENIRPVRIDAIIDSQIRSANSQFQNADIQFTDRPDDDYVFALADDSIYEILMALLENGVQHNTKDDPAISVGLDVGDDFVTVRIRDNGPGIAKDRQDIIFGREEKDQLHHGQGFSLFFVDKVVQKYSGNIWVENNSDGDGATFYLNLPRPDETPDVDPTVDTESTQ
jgi:PAS domain S-box-containing protein